ncbi:hypothetical protein LguiA_027991 [Lonicera macranthoides]
MPMGKSEYEESLSTTTYLFCGLSLFFALVVLSIVIISCYMRMGRPNSAVRDDTGIKEKPQHCAITVVDDEPRIIVIMAGDQNPSHLATPVPMPIPVPVPAAGHEASRFRLESAFGEQGSGVRLLFAWNIGERLVSHERSVN